MPKTIKKPQFMEALHLEKKKQIWRIFQALKSRILANGWWHYLDSNVFWARFKIVHSRLGFGLMGDLVKDLHATP